MSRRPHASAKNAPRRVVALGGGTGLPAVLGGLRHHFANGDVSALTAVVTMSDDGGSSGRLRRSRGLPPPGDVRNCLVALSAEADLLSGLFQHRYDGGEELAGHNLGNLILAALAEQTGSFLKAVEVSSRVLRTVGRILPVTLADVALEAELDDGTVVSGESQIGGCSKRIRRVRLQPGDVRATPGVVQAILEADLVVYGPGSIYTSVVPNLLLAEIGDALRRTRAVRILVGNLVSERGEATGLQHHDHLQAIDDHVGAHVVDGLLVHEGFVDPAVLERYRGEGATLLDVPKPRPGVAVFCRNLIDNGIKLRHDPQATADGLLEAWREISRIRRQQAGSTTPRVSQPGGTRR